MSKAKSPASFSLATLEETGSLVGGIVQKDIEWTAPGNKHCAATVNIMPIGYDTMIALSRMPGEVDLLVRRVAISVVDDAGTPILTPANIMGDPQTGKGRMIDTLFLALLGAVNEVNSYTGK